MLFISQNRRTGFILLYLPLTTSDQRSHRSGRIPRRRPPTCPRWRRWRSWRRRLRRWRWGWGLLGISRQRGPRSILRESPPASTASRRSVLDVNDVRDVPGLPDFTNQSYCISRKIQYLQKNKKILFSTSLTECSLTVTQPLCLIALSFDSLFLD